MKRVLFSFERRWARHLLAAFTPAHDGALDLQTASVRYAETMELILRAAGPKGSIGLRGALWIAALAPLWCRGRITTISGLAPAKRAGTIITLSTHPWRVIRELTMLLKMVACMALFRDPTVRHRSGYASHPDGGLVSLGGPS